jgi:hypothetical protein
MNTNNIQISILVTVTEPTKTSSRNMVNSVIATGSMTCKVETSMDIEPTVSITDVQCNNERCDMEIDMPTIYFPPIHPVNMEID